MSAGVKEKIARAIRAAWHGGDENDVAEAVLAVLRDQEPVARARWVENGCALEIVGLTNSGEFVALSAAKRKPPRFDLFAAHVPPAASYVPDELQPEPLRPDGPAQVQFSHIQYVKGWNDCRAAMLAAAPKPEGE